jgi:predicted O-linked N-acetylglucosamine transferase (SPINDLY family)
MPGGMTVDQQLRTGLSLHQARRLAEAEKIYRQVLGKHPKNADALHLLGALSLEMGRLDAAVELIGRAVRIQPDFAEAFNSLGIALKNSRRFDEAIVSFREAKRLKPDLFEAITNLGSALTEIGLFDEAIEACREAIRINPGFGDAHNNLGIALGSVKRFEEAFGCFRQAIRLKPELVEAYSNLGSVLTHAGQLGVAVAVLREAIRLRPGFADAQSNLGHALWKSGQFDEATIFFREALRLKPDSAEAYGGLGNTMRGLGRLDEAVAAFRQALRIKPEDAGVYGNLLFTLNYHPDIEAETILAEHKAWADRHARPHMGKRIPFANECLPERRLRIGYVSPDFRRHSVGYFILPLLENHKRVNFEIFCYAGIERPDDMTERMKRCCDGWRDIISLTDEAAAKLVRSDGIDILVDLSGHTSGNRLGVFARKPAPIQVSYLGYANTTGMTAIDYRLTDALADPPGMTEQLNVENLWRLERCAWCYQPAEDAPEVEARGDGPITFGCFNAFPKVNSKLVAIWVELLKRVPGSRLLMKSAGAGELSAQERVIEQFAACGVGRERIEMLGRIADPRGHLEAYQRVDVALDTFPYHGTTTTCEAMWMGVPVVSMAGRTHVSRVGASLLNNAGLPELIAGSAEEYVSIAADLAKDLPRLADLRRTMRERMRGSTLMDASRFARNVEAAYREMWKRWCMG